MAISSGHLEVIESPRSGLQWVALSRDADGRHKKRLGPAWVRAHGTTERCGTKKRAADSRKPDGCLSPKEAEEELRKILAAAPREKLPTITRHTLGEACAEGPALRRVRPRPAAVHARRLPQHGQALPRAALRRGHRGPADHD